MTSFFLLSAALVAAALLRLALVVLRPQQDKIEDTRDHNVRIARERLADLRTEQQRGELSEEEFAQAEKDLQIALAQDLSSGKGLGAKARAGSPLTLALVVLLVPVIVAVVYLRTGSPEYLQVAGPGVPAQGPAHMASGGQMPPIEELTAQLEQRLIAEPNNPQGWFLLGRTYMKLNDYDGAVRAFRRLNEILPDDPSAKITLVDALAMQNQGEVPDEGVRLLDEILSGNPNAVTALWLAGQAAATRGQAHKAVDYWQRAYPLLVDQPDLQQELGEMMTQTAQEAGISLDVTPIKPVTDIAPMPVAAAPPTQPTESAPAMTEGPKLQVAVAMDPQLLDQVKPEDTLFIYAKAQQGPPMPLAVARLRVADLPASVTLNDSMAMLPQMRLSSFDQVLVGARISSSGQAIPQSGDLQSPEQLSANNNPNTIELLINQKRP